MTLIDGDRIITAKLYDDEHEEFIEKKMSIIDCLNAYTDEGVTEANVVEQPRWIPVSERLPENFQRVLVTVVRYNGDKVVRVAEYYNRNGVFQIKENDEQWEVGEKGLLAWMPLPAPCDDVS